MFEERLEIRGISQKQIIAYLISLKGKENGNHQLHFSGEGWKASVSEEYFFRILQSDIPKVFVTFTSEDEGILREIIAQFRKKTVRAGG